ncbi:MAG: hypothetical protein ACO1SV_13815 [Fimbriimonas sp.]
MRKQSPRHPPLRGVALDQVIDRLHLAGGHPLVRPNDLLDEPGDRLSEAPKVEPVGLSGSRTVQRFRHLEEPFVVVENAFPIQTRDAVEREPVRVSGRGIHFSSYWPGEG